MKSYEYISQNEIEEIDKVKVDKKIVENIKRKSDNTFYIIQKRKTLDLINNNLKENEVIEFYCTGRNYSIEATRLGFATSIKFGELANPIFGWNTNGILIKTNMRMIFVEATMGFEYSKHYEINQEIHVVKKKEMFYLIVDGDEKKTIIEYNNDRYDLIIDSISDKTNIVIDKKLNHKALNVGVGIGTFLYIVPAILITIFMIIYIITSN
jgi:hypothetical protein